MFVLGRTRIKKELVDRYKFLKYKYLCIFINGTFQQELQNNTLK